MLAFLYMGQRKPVGTLFLCGVVTALADACICFQYDGFQGKAVRHAVIGGVLGLLGTWTYLCYEGSYSFIDFGRATEGFQTSTSTHAIPAT